VKFSLAIFLSEGFVSAFPGIILQFLLIPAVVTALDPEYRKKIGKT